MIKITKEEIKTNRVQFKYNDLFVIAEINFIDQKDQNKKLQHGGYLNLCFLNTDAKGVNHQNVEAKVFQLTNDEIKVKNYELSHNYFNFISQLLKIENNKKADLMPFYELLFNEFKKANDELIAPIDFKNASGNNKKPYYFYSKALPEDKRIPKKTVNKVISTMGHKFYDKLSEKNLNVVFTDDINKARIVMHKD